MLARMSGYSMLWLMALSSVLTVAVFAADPVVSYYPLDYTFTHKGNDTTLTGVRSVNDSSSLVYLSGWTWINLEYNDEGKKTNYAAFIYKGTITGAGTWYGNFNYPSFPGANVSGTFFYGPCSASYSGIVDIPDEENFFQAVGDYETVEGGMAQYGMLFQGYLNGTGEWKTLSPTSLVANPVDGILGTIVHSTMGGLAVGNYNTESAPNKFHAFVYDIAADTYTEIVFNDPNGIPPSAFSITAYCIWHNAGTSTYAIAGGIGKLGAEDGFIVDWDATTRTPSNWRFYHHDNSTITHFQGMWPDVANQGVGYSFSSNWVSLITGDRGTSFVYVSNITSPDRSTDNVNWYDYHYPDTINNSANSVYYNYTVAFFELPEEIYAHGFVAQFDFSVHSDDEGGGGNDDILSRDGVIAVSVVGSVVGLAVLGYFAYAVSSKGAAASASAATATAATATTAGVGNTSATANPMTNSVQSGIALSDGSANF